MTGSRNTAEGTEALAPVSITLTVTQSVDSGTSRLGGLTASSFIVNLSLNDVVLEKGLFYLDLRGCCYLYDLTLFELTRVGRTNFSDSSKAVDICQVQTRKF